MLKPKSSLLQIRIEPELLEQFRLYSESRGLTVSMALRSAIQSICEAQAQKIAARQAYLQRQSEKTSHNQRYR